MVRVLVGLAILCKLHLTAESNHDDQERTLTGPYSGVQKLMSQRRTMLLCAVSLLLACGDKERGAEAAGDAGIWNEDIQVEEFPAIGTSEEEDLFKFVDVGVLQTSCAFSGCHFGGKEPAAGLDLSTEPFSALMGMSTALDRPLVVPGDPDGSYLIEKLTSDKPEAGERMPLGSKLEDYQLALVRTWISAGAKGPKADRGDDGGDEQDDK